MSTTVKPGLRKRTTTVARRKQMRVLVGTAGDSDSIGALRVASELARLRAATVFALGVATPFPHNLSTLVSFKQPTALDEESRLDVLGAVRRQLNSLPTTATWTKRAMIGWPADVINELAHTWDASLVIVGIGRHGRLDRLFGSETAIAIMRRATRPVLAVPPRTLGLPHVALAAIDFTPASIAAAELAASLLAPGGTLIAAYAASFAGVQSRDGDLIDVYRAGAKAKLDDVARALRRDTRRRVQTVMLEDEPGEALLDAARRKHCDLIALGGHEQGLMDRILLGSVRTRVLRGAKCSVLIAGPKARP